MRGLTESFGRHRALDLVWYGGWCNYMTRVADAFQLPLEKENVFAPAKKADEKNRARRTSRRARRTARPCGQEGRRLGELSLGLPVGCHAHAKPWAWHRAKPKDKLA